MTNIKSLASNWRDKIGPDIDRQLLLDKAEELDKTIRTLSAVRDGLRHTADCSAPCHLECSTFRCLMGLAASGAIKGVSYSLDRSK